MAELLGEHHYQMDPKGRISLPAGYREPLAGGVYITLGQDGCLYAFSQEQWERERDQVDRRSIADPRNRAYARMFFGNAERTELDGQGRLVVPRKLREAVHIRGEVTVLGVGHRLEIWARDAWERYEEAQQSQYQAGALIPPRE